MRRLLSLIAATAAMLAGSVVMPTASAVADYYTIFGGAPMVVSNPQSNAVIDVTGFSKNQEAKIQSWPFVGKGNQLWQFYHRTRIDGSDYWYMVAEHSGQCLDVQWGSHDTGAPIWQWPCNYGTAQLWAIDWSGVVDQHGVSSMRLRNLGSQMCLTLPGAQGGQLFQSPCGPNGAQEWQFTHPIVSIANSIVLSGGPTSFNNVNPRRFTASPWQNFQTLGVNSGSAFKISDGRGGCLRPVGPFYYLHGAPLAPYSCTGSAIESWRKEFRGNDFLGVATWRIVNSQSGYCLDFDGGIPPEQAALRTWPCTTSWTQSWYLYA